MNEEQRMMTQILDQYLTFILNDEEYGVNILKVRGIQGWEKTTPIPNVPDYVLGVINLRGEVVPIIDLRKRFDLEVIPYDARTVVIVVRVEQKNIEQANNERIIGLVVDAVSEVYKVNPADLKQTPDFNGDVDTDFVRDLAMIEDKMVMLLEIDNLIDWSLLGKSAEVVKEPEAMEA